MFNPLVMKISPFAGLLLFVGGVFAAYFIFKPRKASSASTSKKLTQAEADAIAKKYEDFKNSGNAEILIFPSPSQKLMIKLNEAGYSLDESVMHYTPSSDGSPHKTMVYKEKAVYVGGIVHQLAGYKYSDGFTKEPEKPKVVTSKGTLPKAIDFC